MPGNIFYRNLLYNPCLISWFICSNILNCFLCLKPQTNWRLWRQQSSSTLHNKRVSKRKSVANLISPNTSSWFCIFFFTVTRRIWRTQFCNNIIRFAYQTAKIHFPMKENTMYNSCFIKHITSIISLCFFLEFGGGRRITHT